MAEDPEEINPQLIYICTIPLEDIMMYMTPLPVPWPSVQWHPEVLEKGTYPHQFVCVAPGTLTLYSVGEDHHLDVWGPSGLLLLGCSFLRVCVGWAVHGRGRGRWGGGRVWGGSGRAGGPGPAGAGIAGRPHGTSGSSPSRLG